VNRAPETLRCTRRHPPLGRVLHALAALGLMAAAAGPIPPAAAQPTPPIAGPCGDPIGNGTGPWDYRSEPAANKRLIESQHFTPNVETLIRPQSGGSLGADIDFTLRAFPNHHRALIAMTALGKKLGAVQPAGAQFSVECYFQRAIVFRADDGIVRMLYARFLYAQQRPADAVRQLEAADELAADNGFTHYNIGLIHLEARQFDAALVQAHRALALGFTRPGLKEALVAAGRWQEPPAQVPPAEPAAPR
jgi:hypothetical protein